MISPDLIVSTFLSPAILAFLIGVIAVFLKSDLQVPPQLFESLSIYLLLSIGIKGGAALAQVSPETLLYPAIATLFMALLTPCIAYYLARRFGRLERVDAGAIAAHYGSVSAVTFIAALTAAQHFGLQPEDYLTALLVMFEIPGIVVALLLVQRKARDMTIGRALREILTGKSIILLVGGSAMGAFATPESRPALEMVFVAPFSAILIFFMLELGVVAAQRWDSIERRRAFFMLGYGVGVPLLFAALGLAVGLLAGFSPVGLAVFATMCASASYIAAPAAVRLALPSADPTLYLTLSIGITLPFNIVFGIPLYYTLALYLTGAG